MAFTELAQRGRARLKAEPTFANELQNRPRADDIAILLAEAIALKT